MAGTNPRATGRRRANMAGKASHAQRIIKASTAPNIACKSIPFSVVANSCKGCNAKCCRKLAVVLTIPEALRLAKAVQAPPDEYLELSCHVDFRKTPHFPLLSKEGRSVLEYFIIIKKQANGDCVFLSRQNTCKIYLDRPFVCRLYPFELTENKKVKKGALCPFHFIREPQTDSEAKLLEEDLRLHGIMARRWNVEKGKMEEIGKILEYFTTLQEE